MAVPLPALLPAGPGAVKAVVAQEAFLSHKVEATC